MPRKPNPDIGTVLCPVRTCTATAHVRKMVKGRREGELYAVCPVHGPTMTRGAEFQEWMLANVKIYGPDGPPIPEPVSRAAPEPAPPPPPPPPPAAPARRDFFDW